MKIFYTLKSKGAFTLIELLVAVCIFAVMVVGLGAVFSSGLNIFKRASGFGYEEVALLTEMERFSQNMREHIELVDVEFTGDKQEISFGTINAKTLFKVTYKYDPATKHLIYQKVKYEDILKEEEAGEAEVYKQIDAFSADTFEFSYLLFDDTEKIYMFRDTFDPEEEEPIAVKVNLRANEKEYEKTVFIPIYYFAE